MFSSVLSGQTNGLFQGSVPTPAVPGPRIALTLDDAIQRGLRTNLGLLTRETTSEAVRAQRIRALSELLPQISGFLSQNVQQVNLETLGLSLNSAAAQLLGIPRVVGPFSYQFGLVNVAAPVFNWSLVKNLSAARASEQAAQLATLDARDLVVQAVVYAYLRIAAGMSRVESLQAQVITAETIYRRAVDQKAAGLVPAIDVLRAQVEWQTQQQRLLVQINQIDTDKLVLGRIIGFAPSQPFDLADKMPFTPLRGVTLPDAIRNALARRPDYQSAARLLDAAEESVKAARAQWYPVIDLNGYYGFAGVNVGRSHGVFLVTGALTFNIFNGGRIHADIEQARALREQRANELADLGAQIEYQVRAAFLYIQSAAARVAVAQSNVDLAGRTLTQARDRFLAGIADTLEVVQAQESVATASDDLINAAYAHNAAKAALARAMGQAEQTIKQLIEVK